MIMTDQIMKIPRAREYSKLLGIFVLVEAFLMVFWSTATIFSYKLQTSLLLYGLQVPNRITPWIIHFPWLVITLVQKC